MKETNSDIYRVCTGADNDYKSVIKTLNKTRESNEPDAWIVKNNL